ncbi:MAG: hypothetical protein ACR2Q3_16145 [Woeseiaceae bacterium]
MSTDATTAKYKVERECALFLVLFLTGIFVLPSIIYLVGDAMFGDYGGTGFSAFYGELHSRFRAGDLGVWFLVLAPYVGWQLLRITIRGFRRIGKSDR